MKEQPTQHRLLADENTSHRLVSACLRLATALPIVHIARWQDGAWLGLDDAALLMSCAGPVWCSTPSTGPRPASANNAVGREGRRRVNVVVGTVDVLRIEGSRYAAERWMRAHVGRNELVAVSGLREYLPRLDDFHL